MTENQCSKNHELHQLATPLFGKWVPIIILTLETGSFSFGELERSIPAISRKVLSDNLKQLCAMGIVNKQGESFTGFPVEYKLTSLGKSMLPLFYQLKDWLRDHREEIEGNIKKESINFSVNTRNTSVNLNGGRGKQESFRNNKKAKTF